MVAILAGFLFASGGLAGSVATNGNSSTYTNPDREFSVTTPRGWWFRDHYKDLGGIWMGEPQVGGAAGNGTWDPQFIVIKQKPGQRTMTAKALKSGGKRGPQVLGHGSIGDVPYDIWWELGWTYVRAISDSPKASWEIEVHIPKSNWRRRLPLALSIIRSFRLLQIR